MSDNAATEQQEKLIFSLSIHACLESNQKSHGVMHEDYAQYQQYCTNRLSRLRHCKAVKKDLVHNSKYVEGVQMRRNAYCSRKLKEVAEGEEEEEMAMPRHENFVWVLYYQAERAWAHACDLQQQQQKNSSFGVSGKSSSRKHSLSRLRKGTHHAEELLVLARKCCDERTVEECEAYQGWMMGNYGLQKADFSLALEHYSKAMTILLKLSQEQRAKAEDDPKLLVLADLWSTRAENVLRPLVRYCQYECKDHTSSSFLPQEDVQATEKAEADSEIMIVFGGRKIPLDPYKHLCVLYLKLESLLEQEGKEEDTFLSLLSVYDDAIAWVQGELKNYQSLQAGPAVNAKIQELELLQAYWKQQKLQLGMNKNEAYVKECQSDAELVHVYDALLQNAQAIAQLHEGVSSEGNSSGEEAQAHLLRIRAFRCFYMARLYHSSMGKNAEALALLSQTTKLANRAMEEIAACINIENADNYLDALDVLLSDLKNVTCRIQAAQYLERHGGDLGGKSGSSSQRPLWLRLDDMDAGDAGNGTVVLGEDPLEPIPIPCKPAFFDLAWSESFGNINVTALQKQIEMREPKSTPSGGGFFSSWF